MFWMCLCPEGNLISVGLVFAEREVAGEQSLQSRLCLGNHISSGRSGGSAVLVICITALASEKTLFISLCFAMSTLRRPGDKALIMH